MPTLTHTADARREGPVRHTTEAIMVDPLDDQTVEHQTSAYLGIVGATGTPMLDYRLVAFSAFSVVMEDLYIVVREGQSGVAFRCEHSKADFIYVNGGQDYAFSIHEAESFFRPRQNNIANLSVLGSGTDGGGLRLLGTIGCVFTNTILRRCKIDGILLDTGEDSGEPAARNVFSGVAITRPSLGDSDSFDGVRIADGVDNLFDGLAVTEEDGAADYRYAMYIDAGSTGNRLGSHKLTEGVTGLVHEETPGDNELSEETIRAVIRGTLTVATDGLRYYIDAPFWILDVRASLDTPATGADLIVDVLVDGTTIYPTATEPTIAAAANLGSFAVPDDRAVAAGSYIQLDVTQVGSGTAGADLVVEVRGLRL